MLNAFTVDVEDYFQVSAFESFIDRDDWPGFESRVERNTWRILDLMSEHQVSGTFFVLGWVAEHHPQLVREIAARGHHVGSHSFWHRLVYNQTREEFREDLRKSKRILEDTLGTEVDSYRAPSFSITRRSLWALEILVEEGFRYDSSIYPTYHDRYGIPDAEQQIHQIETPAGPIWEFPPATVKLAAAKIPVSGGGYFRLKPYPLTRRLLRRLHRTTRHPFVFYIHPWEVDPAQPRLKVGSRTSRLRHYLNLHRTEARLGCLLQQFRFSTLLAALHDHCQHGKCPVARYI